MKGIIVGTAGHVDHGKTELVKALTGVDTDRLPEEKARGVSIELGFAPLRFGEELLIAIVDVPGHEKFVKNMISGATGIDVVLLCIAADEGIKPQTTEHIHISKILGIKKGLIAVTKSDLAREGSLENLKKEISEISKGTLFEGASVIPTSVRTRNGIELLKETLKKYALEAEEKRKDGNFRLNVDRVFQVKGFGTVVTGTSQRGKIRVGDEVCVYSKNASKVSAIRAIENFGEKINEAGGGQRLGISLSKVSVDDVKRGDVIGKEGKVIKANVFDAWVDNLKNSGVVLKNNSRLKIAWGTSEDGLTLKMFGKGKKSEIKPGTGGFARICLAEPSFVEFSEEFILRNLSPLKTIGGGVCLIPNPRALISDYEEYSKGLESLRSGDIKSTQLVFAKEARFNGISRDKLSVLLDRRFGENDVNEGLQDLIASGELLEPGTGRILTRENFELLSAELKLSVSRFHEARPMEAGIKIEELKQHLSRICQGSLVDAVINILCERNSLQREKDAVKIPGRDVVINKHERIVTEKIVGILKEGGACPPTFKELIPMTGVLTPKLREYLSLLEREGQVVKVSQKLFYHSDYIKSLERLLIEVIRGKKYISVSDFKGLAGVSRKYAIPLLEYFDKERLTLRRGDDTRILRSGPT